MGGQPPGLSFVKQGGALSVSLGLGARVTGAPRAGTDTAGMLGDWEKGHWNEGVGRCEQNLFSGCNLRGKQQDAEGAWPKAMLRESGQSSALTVSNSLPVCLEQGAHLL